jgi:hypothetical protein
MLIVTVSSHGAASFRLQSPQLACVADALAWRGEMLTRLEAEGWVRHYDCLASMPLASTLLSAEWLATRDGKTQLKLDIVEVTGIVPSPSDAVVKIAEMLVRFAA